MAETTDCKEDSLQKHDKLKENNSKINCTEECNDKNNDDDPENTEERVRVDRRKLELLLQGFRCFIVALLT